MELTLAKALKQKKRIAAEISKVEADIRANNSVTTKATCEVNVGELLNRRTALVNFMINLKLAINEANRPIMKDIFLISELKSEIALLSSLDTKHGMVKANEYREEFEEFVATVRKAKAEELISRSQAAIDTLQEKLDTFNYTTKIVLPDPPQPAPAPTPAAPPAAEETPTDEDGIVGL